MAGLYLIVMCVQLCCNYAKKGSITMPLIKPIKDTRNTTEISKITHKEQVLINHIDKAIYESERELATGAEAVDAEIVFAELEKRHFG